MDFPKPIPWPVLWTSSAPTPYVEETLAAASTGPVVTPALTTETVAGRRYHLRTRNGARPT